MHRDLKPANILIKVQKFKDELIEVVKITDFGVSTKLENGESTIFKTIEGTLSYLAPELKIDYHKLKLKNTTNF